MYNAAVEEVRLNLENRSTGDSIAWLNERFGTKAQFSTSLGLEDQVITWLISHHGPGIGIFTLDTGRLFQESYDLLDLTQKKFNVPIRTFFPDPKDVEQLIALKGPNSFYDSVENRKECCHLRKVLPLKRALADTTVWITGIRSGQSGNRSAMKIVEWDSNYQLIKYNPLLDWSAQEVDDFIGHHKIPVNTLHRKGFPSIGCAPCTRAVLDGEDPRAGRWWWESSAKECGLHETTVKQGNT